MAPILFFKRFLLFDITLGRNGIGLETFHPHLFEKDSHLHLTALDARQLLNHMGCLGNTRREMLLQLALWLPKPYLLECLYSSLLILLAS